MTVDDDDELFSLRLLTLSSYQPVFKHHLLRIALKQDCPRLIKLAYWNQKSN